MRTIEEGPEEQIIEAAKRKAEELIEFFLAGPGSSNPALFVEVLKNMSEHIEKLYQGIDIKGLNIIGSIEECFNLIFSTTKTPKEKCEGFRVLMDTFSEMIISEANIDSVFYIKTINQICHEAFLLAINLESETPEYKNGNEGAIILRRLESSVSEFKGLYNKLQGELAREQAEELQ